MCFIFFDLEVYDICGYMLIRENLLIKCLNSQILNLDTFYMDNINYFLELVIHFLAFSKSVNSKCLISAAIKCFPKS